MSLSLDSRSVPLLKTSVNASVVDDDATILLSQQFLNPVFQEEDKQLEAVYKFPLQSSSAVYFFKTIFRSEKGDVVKTLVGKSVEKQAAREKYEQAKANGKTAQLLEQDFDNSPDVFVISLGNIPSDAMTVDVDIGYYIALPEEEKGNVTRFLFPTTLAGRYGKEVENGWTKQNVSTAATGFEIEINISLSEYISLIESPSHRITTKLMVDGIPSKACVSFSIENEVLKEDFVLKIGGAEAPSSVILVQDPSTIINDTFLKSFGDATIAKLAFRCVDSTEDDEYGAAKQNFVFVVDRSGSMEGTSMENCKKALQMCLSCLPENCLFNICSFGNKHSFLFPESREYSEDSVEEARAHVDAMSADMGGTEILAPLKEIVESQSSDLPKVVFLLTDGEVSNTEVIVQMIKKAHKKTGARLFTCGIGSGVSTHLVEGLAKAGGGTATFIAANEKINAKLTSQMEQAMYPPFENLEVEMGDLELCQAKIAWNMNSVLPPFALNGQNLSCFIALETGSIIDIEEKVSAGESVETIKLIGTQKTDEGEKEIVVAEIDLNKDYFQSECNLVIPALKEQVKLAEESTKKSEKSRALELCLCANIVSKFTSLVAVEELPGGEIVEASAMPASIEKQPEASIYESEDADETEKEYMERERKEEAYDKISMQREKEKLEYERYERLEYAQETERVTQAIPTSAPPVVNQTYEHIESVTMSYTPKPTVAVVHTLEEEDDELDSMAYGISPEQLKKDQIDFDFATSSDDDKLTALVKLQNIDGSYDPTPELARLIGKKNLGDNAETPGFATAVAIVFMEERLAAMSADWKLLHKKAMSSLQKRAKNYKAILELARTFLI